MAYATQTDVQNRTERTLTSQQLAIADVRLADVERKIKRRIPDLSDRVVASADYHDTVVQVEADVVLRGLLNPDGYLMEMDGNYSYQRASASVVAPWELSDDEWEELGFSSVFTVAPTLNVNPTLPPAEYPNRVYFGATGTVDPDPDEHLWSPLGGY